MALRKRKMMSFVWYNVKAQDELECRRRQAALDALIQPSSKVKTQPLTWRSPRLSDWKLKVGDKTFDVHTAILGEGSRQSDVFYAQFKDWQQNGRSTDLSILLPPPCLSLVEPLLDYFYHGTLALQANNVVIFFMLADILQIPSLTESTLDFMKEHLDCKSAPAMLACACEFCPRLQVLVKECIPVVASTLNEDSLEHLANVPDDILSAILQHSRLRADPRIVSKCLVQRLRLAEQVLQGVPEDVFRRWASHISCVDFDDAAFLLGAALRFNCDQCRGLSLNSISRNFASCHKGYLAEIPSHDVICRLLDSNELRCRDEDQVFDMIEEYCKIKSDCLSKQQATELRERCRFMLLSSGKVAEAATHADMPMQYLKLGLAGRVLKDTGSPKDFADFLEKIKDQSGAPHALERLLPRKA